MYGAVLLTRILCSVIGCLGNSMTKNYQKTQGNITTDVVNKNQTITYIVDKEYVHIVPFLTRTNPRYENGSCTVYYAPNNPNDYSINVNPSFMLGIISIVLCVLVSAIMWFLFLRSNKDVAGVLGGINAASTVSNIFFRR